MLTRKRLQQNGAAPEDKKKSCLQATSSQGPTTGVEADSEIPLEPHLDETDEISEPKSAGNSLAELGQQRGLSHDQLKWERNQESTSTKEHVDKQSPQQEAKRVEYKQEKPYTDTLSRVRSAVGDGRGESSTTEVLTPVDANAAGQKHNDQSQNGKELNSDKAHPLFIFYDCETTGLDIDCDHITDIGAKVVDSPVPLKTPTFLSLVATSREIPPRVTKLTGITAAMLHGEKPISEVFPLFLNWVTTTTTYVSNVTKTPHYPVLVAHNGFDFDFPVMFAEVERHRGALCMSDFEAKNIHFSDTLPLLHQMKQDGCRKLRNTMLGMAALHSHIVKTPRAGAHRALPDVLAMEAILTHTSLGDCLTNLPVQSAKTQIELWTKQKTLMKALGITQTQAKSLVELGLEYASLKRLCTECRSESAFIDSLRQKGVYSQFLSRKIANIRQWPSS